MLQSLQQSLPNYIKHQIKENQSPHSRIDREHPLTLSSYSCHCQSTNLEANTTRWPSEITRSPREISRCLSQETTTNISPQQVSHFTTTNPISSMDTSLITDTMIDGHTSFHTTLEVITSEGSKPLQIKVDPEASCSSIPLSCFHPKEDSSQTQMDDIVSPWWNMPNLFRIPNTRHSTQEPPPNPTLQGLCIWRFYQPWHSFIIPYIIQIRNSRIYRPQWSTNKLSSNDRHHHKFQNSHLQPAHREISPRSHTTAVTIKQNPL